MLRLNLSHAEGMGNDSTLLLINATSAGNATAFWDKVGPWLSSRLTMEQAAVLAGSALLVSLALLLVAALRLRACVNEWRRRKQQRAQSDLHQHPPLQKKLMVGGMIARIEELDSLTPLIVTPSSVSEDSLPPLPKDRSPPFPRRLVPGGGRVCLVPLGTGMIGRGERQRSSASTIPDYEMTISTTFRSHGTIPEVSESAHQSTGTLAQSGSGTSLGTLRGPPKGPFADLDLISIDRTSVSTLERPVAKGIERPRPSFNGLSNANGIPPPESTSGVKRPASVNGKPLLRYDPSRAAENRMNRDSSGESLSSQLSSPMGSSSAETGSELDTTGSVPDLSDSVYLASESETSDHNGPPGRLWTTEGTQSGCSAAGGSSSTELGELSNATLEGNAQRRFHLHRIEEESEAEAEAKDRQGNLHRAAGTEESLSALSADPCSVLDSECNVLSPSKAPPPAQVHKSPKEGLI